MSVAGTPTASRSFLQRALLQHAFVRTLITRLVTQGMDHVLTTTHIMVLRQGAVLHTYIHELTDVQLD